MALTLFSKGARRRALKSPPTRNKKKKMKKKRQSLTHTQILSLLSSGPTSSSSKQWARPAEKVARGSSSSSSFHTFPSRVNQHIRGGGTSQAKVFLVVVVVFFFLLLLLPPFLALAFQIATKEGAEQPVSLFFFFIPPIYPTPFWTQRDNPLKPAGSLAHSPFTLTSIFFVFFNQVFFCPFFINLT